MPYQHLHLSCVYYLHEYIWCVRVSLLFLYITYREYKLATAWHVSCWRLSKSHNMTSSSRGNRVVKVMLWFAKYIIHSRKAVNYMIRTRMYPIKSVISHTGQKSLYIHDYTWDTLFRVCTSNCILGCTPVGLHVFLLIHSVPFRSCCMFTFSININLYA